MSAIEPKVRNVGFGWEAIDIFLFSNGQKSSPPRKYHLRMDELDWWEATLNHLAKSHYGSSHTAIELYTLCGNKIEGPHELCDGMPCVAVVPPDTFTDAGYEKYLMRASRSFEKRKAKNANLIDQSEDKVSDALQIDNEKPQLVNATDIESSNGPEKNVAASTVMINSQKSIMHKSDLTDPQLPRNINAPSSNVRNEKRNSNMARIPFMRTPLQSRKNSKQDSQMKTPKRSLKTNEPVPILTDKSKEVPKYLNQNEMSEKSLLASPPSGITSVPTTKPSIPAPPGKSHTMLTVNNQDFVTNPVPLQDLIGDKEILVLSEDSNLFRNPIPEVKSVKLDTYLPLFVDEITEFSPTCVDEEIQTKVEISSCEVNTATRKYSSPSNSKIIVIPATIASQSNMKCDVPLEDNCIAVINKGDAVNLKLQIELQNGSPHTHDQSNLNLKNLRQTRSLSNLFKKRKSDHSGDQTVAPTKSLESVICGINECYTKVVVVQCSCCGNKTTVPRVDTVPVYKDPNGFFILMPTTAQQGNNSCLCCRNHQKLCTDNRAMSCVEELCKPKSSTIYPCVQEVGMVMTLTGSFGSQTEKRQRTGADTCIMAKRILGNIMSINKDRCSVDECSTSPSRVIQRLEYIVSTANMPRALPYERVDSYTQTEWCSILLETQRHEDGRYSFHFPSLQVLKYYSLI